ncbi:MAG TPA: chemotaxis protein CheW [Chloroflexota bacterium]|nr:chemotaxis protein CheW [Chloroflexota bacterium]
MSRDGPPDAAERAAEAQAAAILRERARRLALAPVVTPRADVVEALTCRVGEEQYAVPLAALRGLERAAGLTPLPCTPPFVAGLLNVRGEVVAVLDLGVALGLRAAPAAGGAGQVLLVETARGRVGLLVDEVFDVRQLSRAALAPSLSHRDYAAGVADARTVLLAVDRLLADGRFEVDEDVP